MRTLGYKFLPHTTDAYIQATGVTLEQAFEHAGAALFDVMCNVRSITPRITDSLEVAGEDEVALLHDWLESLLLKFNLDGKVYSKFRVLPVQKSREGFEAKAKISGEKYDRKKHGAKVEVKAATYHKMEVIRGADRTTLKFILDL